MSSNTSVVELGSCSERQEVVSNEQIDDRISSLPDSILVHILSFLPTKDALKTVLIRRFGNLWTSIYNLDFNVCLYHICEPEPEDDIPRFEDRLINFIRQVLIQHERPDIHRFRLRFEFSLWELALQEDDGSWEEMEVANEIAKWIHFALRKKAKVLDLDFRACSIYCSIYSSEDFHTLPNVVFTSDFLIELNLVQCCVEVEPQEDIHMRSLKTLLLESVVTSDKTMMKILSGCPVLENLVLLECYGLRKLNFTSENLTNVVIKLIWFEKSRLKISCPYVKSLNFSGGIHCLVVNDVPSSIVEAALNFYGNINCTFVGYWKLKMLFEKFHHAKVFTVSDATVLVSTMLELLKISCPCSNWRCLVLKTMLTKWHLPGIASLLRNSPNLEMLDIHINPGNCPFIYHGDLWLSKFEIDGDDFWNLQWQSFHCLTNHLKTIRIRGFNTKPCAIQLVKFLLKTAAVLVKMVIETNQDVNPPDQKNHFMSAERLQEFSQELLSFPRASQQAAVVFLC